MIKSPNTPKKNYNNNKIIKKPLLKSTHIQLFICQQLTLSKPLSKRSIFYKNSRN